MDRNVKLELELQRVKESVEEYKRLSKEGETNIRVVNSERISALQKLTELQGQHLKKQFLKRAYFLIL